MLVADKRENPSNYAVVAISEGATIAGGDMIETGDADAFGNRKLGGIGELISDTLEEHTGDKVIYQRLAYLMRSGAPDSLDLIVAKNYAVLAADLALEGASGRMVAVVDGRYTAVPISATREGENASTSTRSTTPTNYRPKVREVMGMPMFLY